MAHAKSTGNPNDFILPDLGEGVHEAELIAWKVQVGQTVKEHDILAEMETDKALVEVPSPRDGTIAVLHGSAGEILKVGNPLVTYAGEGGAAAPAKSAKPEGKKAAGSTNGTHHAPAPAAKGGGAEPDPDNYERTEDDGTVMHSEMVWPEGGRVMVHSRGKEDDAFGTPRGGANIYVVVDDPDAVWARANGLEARVVRPMEDTDYGSRGFSIADPEGNRWSFGTYAGE